MYAVLKEEGVTYIALPLYSVLLNGFDKETFKIPDNLPMWKVQGSKNCIMAVTPSLRDADLLRYKKITSNISYTNIVTKLVPQFKAHLKAFGRLNQDDEMNCSILIAKNDSAYLIQKSDVIKIDSFYEDVGLAVMTPALLLFKDNAPIVRLVKSLVMEGNDVYKTVFPIAILDTKNEKIRYIDSLEEL